MARVREIMAAMTGLAWLAWVMLLAWAPAGVAAIHDAPIVVKGKALALAFGWPVTSYRLLRTDAEGRATVIPFQIDEVNGHGEYLLPQGPRPNLPVDRGLLDGLDELVFMGNDVGSLALPKAYPGDTPDAVFRIVCRDATGQPRGAVYLGRYGTRQRLPSLAPQTYVVFEQPQQTIVTSRYRYTFDGDNYLVMKGFAANDPMNPAAAQEPVIQSSTFYLKADLSYFLTFEANHRSIDSRLEAFKTGPIRVIVRVDFYYTLLKLQIDVGMFTEVSFYSNSVELPAVFYSPIDGRESLEVGSNFYYGFQLVANPGSYRLASNMQRWPQPRRPFWSRHQANLPEVFWAGLYNDHHMIYLEVTPSRQLLANGVQPFLYLQERSGAAVSKVDHDEIAPIEKAPVNAGLVFDLTKFAAGDNLMGFRIFFDHHLTAAQEAKYRNYKFWSQHIEAIRTP